MIIRNLILSLATLFVLLGCVEEDGALYESKSLDVFSTEINKAPTAGTLTIRSETSTSISIGFTAGYDDTTPRERLEYKVLYSTGINQVSSYSSDAVVLSDWQIGAGSSFTLDFNSGTKVYLNVFVKDVQGSISSYQFVESTPEVALVAGGVLSKSSLQNDGLTLSWPHATGGCGGNLYQVVYSASDNIGTADDAVANGTVLMGWQNTNSFDLTGLTKNSTYYFNVLAKDSCGEVASYNSISQLIGIKWLVMYYVDADSNHEEALLNDVNELEAVDLISNNIKVVALISRSSSNYSGDGDWADTRAYEIEYDSTGYNQTFSNLTKRVSIPTLGVSETSNSKLDMGETVTLQNFVSHLRSAYPADRTMVMISNRGTLNSGINTPATESLVASEIQVALQGSIIDIISLDASQMGSVEATYALRDTASIMVASPESTPIHGLPLYNIFESVSGDITPLALSERVVREYKDAYTFGTNVEMPNYVSGRVALTSFDLSKVHLVMSAADALGSAFSANYTSEVSRDSALEFIGGSSVDLYHLAELEANSNGHSAEVQSVMDSIIDSIILHKAGGSLANSNGVSIYFPSRSMAYNAQYDSCQFSTDSISWKNFIMSYSL